MRSEFVSLSGVRGSGAGSRSGSPRLGFQRARLALFGMLACVFAWATPAVAADMVKGDVRVSTENGYARLVFRLDEPIDAHVHLSGTVLVIDFKRPVDISVDRINAGAPDFVSAARRDPDGKAIRMALVRGYRVNPTPAGEKLFVDILPLDWQGLLPSLPQEVIDDLSRRTREAERQLRQQRLFAKNRSQSEIQVKVGTLPTFTRYIFDLPNFANVVPERSDGKLTLNFDQPIKYDLADVRAAMPPTLRSVDSDVEHDSVAVTFNFNGTPDVRLFREDRSVVIDVDNGGKSENQQMTENGLVETDRGGAVKAPMVTAPDTVAPPAAADAPKSERATNDDLPGVPILPGRAAESAPSQKPNSAAESVPVDKLQELIAATQKQVAAAPATVAPAAVAPPPAEKPVEAAAPPRVAEAPKTEPAPAPPRAVEPAKAEPMPASPPAAMQQADAEHNAKPRAVAPPAEMPKAEAPPAPQMREEKRMPVAATETADRVTVRFPFASAVPAAAFTRADTLWVVFGGDVKVNADDLKKSVGKSVRSVGVDSSTPGQTIIRMKLDRPRLASMTLGGSEWSLAIGDTVSDSVVPLVMSRGSDGQGRPTIVIPFSGARQVLRLVDPEVGDKLLVVTAMGPARGFLKPQSFVELRALVSFHGVVIQPIADDVIADLTADMVTISRPGGLTLSSASAAGRDSQLGRQSTFDAQTWGFDRQADFQLRQTELMSAAAGAPDSKRRMARLDLARFYLARDLVPEAKAVVDVVLQDQKSGNDDVSGVVMKAVANVMMERPAEALKDLANPIVGDQQDAPVWRAVAQSREGHWPEARAGFKASEAVIGSMPVELQRIVMLAELRAYIETGDFGAAGKVVNDFDSIGVPDDVKPSLAVLVGRLNEALGKREEAVGSFREASDSSDRRAAVQGRLREIMLRFRMDELSRKDAISELEKLTTTWRGDETEAEGLQHLAHFYTEDGRYRDAFHVMRVALLAHANSDLTRRIQDEAAQTFDSLFLGDRGNSLEPIEALGLFYDYRDLTPIGRRGDEMIRRLADRLVAVDLLGQAAELLDYQVQHRLQGAARAQVATRLAVVYLMDRKPDRAIAALRTTRIAGLSSELRTQRLLLEARAVSAIGQHNLALEITADMTGKEVMRLRADVNWAAKRWRQAAEQIEQMYGERWKDFAPLNQKERSDILRAAFGYALAGDQLAMGALREKYAAKMAETDLRQMFDLATTSTDINTPEFRNVGSVVGAQDRLGLFLDDIKARFPESSLTSAKKQEGMPPMPDMAKPASPKPAGPTARLRADPSPTGSIGERRGSILPPLPPRGVKLNPVPPPPAGVPRLPRTAQQ